MQHSVVYMAGMFKIGYVRLNEGKIIVDAKLTVQM